MIVVRSRLRFLATSASAAPAEPSGRVGHDHGDHDGGSEGVECHPAEPLGEARLRGIRREYHDRPTEPPHCVRQSVGPGLCWVPRTRLEARGTRGVEEVGEGVAALESCRFGVEQALQGELERWNATRARLAAIEADTPA